MEKAILKTLIYYDIFNFPLKVWEIHKWLIGRNASLKQIEKTLRKMGQGVKSQGDYWFFEKQERSGKGSFRTGKDFGAAFADRKKYFIAF